MQHSRNQALASASTLPPVGGLLLGRMLLRERVADHVVHLLCTDSQGLNLGPDLTRLDAVALPMCGRLCAFVAELEHAWPAYKLLREMAHCAPAGKCQQHFSMQYLYTAAFLPFHKFAL